RPDARGRGALHTLAHAARSAVAPWQDDPVREAPRRHAAAPVLARAGARLPRRPPAGAHDRIRLILERIRSRARRAARRGAAARSGAPLGGYDLKVRT